ncbi:hypothetical protein B0H34DRAFT_784189 [Crassisporium funariophilum]|nr:hypothetical protein B0H34DRAFT_784189 [Crassisporium funariophilum]
MSTPVTPSESELTTALIQLKAEEPSLGISKVHALLLKTRPEWTVSEKRIRKILQQEGLVTTSGNPGALDGLKGDEPKVFPSSRVIDHLDIGQWTKKVGVKYFNKKKGKGLVALQDIEEGEVVWREDPFIIAPEWEIYDMQVKSAACGYCTTPFGDGSPLIITCPSSSSSSYCPIRFCNRLCLARSAKTHPLLCAAQNPASVPLLKFARDSQWMALHALAQCTSRILLANQLADVSSASEAPLRSDWEIMRGLAELSMEDRWKYSFQSSSQPEPDRPTWKKSYNLYIQAFQEPKTPQEQKKLAKLLKKPLSTDAEHELFDYDAGFLRGLGRMSLNLEAHGGLYTLHSHLNHSCTPNTSIRHLDTRTALSRITVICKQPVKKGEELLVTYVNPELGWRQRRKELRAWGFGGCTCKRCVEEGKGLSEDGEIGGTGADEMDDLASELKAGLGVM